MRRPVLRRFAHPLSVWIALLAIVLQSVMPMVAQARMRMGAPMAAVPASTAHDAVGTGAHLVHDAVGGGKAHAAIDAAAHAAAGTAAHATADATAHHAPPGNPHAMHGDAPCPYCRVHLDVVSLPPIPNPHWVLLVSVVPRPIADEAVPVTAEPWSPTHPRGPPLIA
jgi:hypothetical protein